jgi:ribonuclease HI
MEAMKEVKRRGFTNVIFETDSKSVVDATHFLHTGVSKFSSLICMIKNMLSLSTNLEVRFIKRQTNIVAHKLTRATISWSSRKVFETIPTCIEPLLLNDMI